MGLKINKVTFFFSLQNKYSVIKTHVNAGKGVRPDGTMLDLVPILSTQSIPVGQKTFIMHATEYKHTSVSPTHRYISAFTAECTKKYNREIIKRFCFVLPSSKREWNAIKCVCFLNRHLNTRHARLGNQLGYSRISEMSSS